MHQMLFTRDQEETNCKKSQWEIYNSIKTMVIVAKLATMISFGENIISSFGVCDSQIAVTVSV